MAPQALDGETLLDRSHRILGVSLDQEENEKTRTRKSNVSPGRRREQVAQAQRTHRQRTQRYIRELENEVLRLRNLHKSSEDNNAILQTQVQVLSTTLLSNNVPLPSMPALAPTISNGVYGSPESLTPFDISEPTTSPSVNIDISQLSAVAPERPCVIVASERMPVDLDFETVQRDHQTHPHEHKSVLQNGTASYPMTNGGALPARLDAQAGVDFILNLERACLPHVKYAMENDLDVIPPNVVAHGGPNIDIRYRGHVFTATASLLQAAETPNPTSQPFKLHESEIDRLLDASRRLKLESEVTPVQVWERVKALANTMLLTPTDLNCLTEDLCKYTFCNSFGTVLDKSVVDVIFAYHFPQLAAISHPSM